MIRDFVKTIRPKHWVKNIIVFVALLLSANFFNIEEDIKSFSTFVAFCLLASSVYVINDIADREKDRKHPEKSKRPIASGRIKINHAVIFAILLALLGLGIGFYIHFLVGLILGVYLISNLFYSFWLEKIVIIDVFVITLGFVLRAIAGAVAIQVEISSWLVVTTMFLALFLALNKRKAELSNKKDVRNNLDEYTLPYLNQLVLITATSIIVSYTIYSFNSPHPRELLWTTPFVIYGVFRYLYLTEVQNYGGQLSTTLLKDKPLVVNILLWGGIVMSILIYFN